MGGIVRAEIDASCRRGDFHSTHHPAMFTALYRDKYKSTGRLVFFAFLSAMSAVWGRRSGTHTDVEAVAAVKEAADVKPGRSGAGGGRTETRWFGKYG